MRPTGGEVMSDIPRYKMDLYEGESSNKGLWVRHEDHAAAIKAAVETERVRCLDIVENIWGYCVNEDGNLRQDPDGDLVRRVRIETAIRWVKVE
jgi:hypothetical protein